MRYEGKSELKYKVFPEGRLNRYIEEYLREGRRARVFEKSKVGLFLLGRYRQEHREEFKEGREARGRRYSDELGERQKGRTRVKGKICVSYRVGPELWELLKKEAEKEGMSVSLYSRKVAIESLTKK
mgnify:FL=1